MHGLFVDAQHCLRVVTPDGVVYATTAEDEWIGHVEMEGLDEKVGLFGNVTLTTPHGAVRGVFDGEDCVTWDDGATWHRLNLSATQYHVLRRRTYVPLTFVAASVVYGWAHLAREWVMYGASRLAKRA